jgi:predicted N-acetyltransferase YhbS
VTPPRDEPVIRVATRHDLEALVAAFGQRMLFTDRIGRTRQRAGELLVAWAGDVPVGNVYLWCEALEEPELRAYFPGVPLLNHLEVAADRRGRGVGTALVRAVERAAARRGYRRLLLGVAPENAAAKDLYGRLGYTDWGGGSIVSRWTEPDGRGGIREASMTVDIMVTSLHPERERSGGAGARVQG